VCGEPPIKDDAPMSRINTNIASLVAQRSLNKNNMQLNTSLQRLSTGLKINTGADDPAGLIASEDLKAEQTGISTALNNAQAAGNIIGTAEGGLNEVSSLLNQLQGLVGQAANSGGLSSDQINADQLQVDSILSTINRIAGATSFQGQKLLDGTLAYTTSGVTTGTVTAVQINAAILAANAPENVVVGVTQSAETASLGYTGGALSAGNNVTLEIGGNAGTTQISLAGGATTANVISAINNVKAATGVSASLSGSDVRLDSVAYGSKQFVSLKTVSGNFTPTSTRAVGRDAVATVNGAAAQADGTHISYRSATLDLSLDLAATGASSANTDSGATSFYITGGGARFSLGSKVTESDKSSIGIDSVSTADLGDSVLGFLSSLQSGQANSLSSPDLTAAQKIVDKAINQVSSLRGRLGAFQKFTIGSTVNALNVAYENVTSAESTIADTDFSAETANLTRAQILSQAATTVLSQANSAPQSVLKLLG
jgi:flagellin